MSIKNRAANISLYFQRPALTYHIAEDYFENNLRGQEGDYTLINGYYTRTIDEDDLTLTFGDTDDGKYHIIPDNSALPVIEYFNILANNIICFL